MKFTSEDLMKVMGLNVGDRVKVYAHITERFEVIRDKPGITVAIGRVLTKKYPIFLRNLEDDSLEEIEYLIDQDYEILPRTKRVGDLSCREMFVKSGCSGCPVRNICNEYVSDVEITEKLYAFLEAYQVNAENHFDQEIYDLLKARLDVIVDE